MTRRNFLTHAGSLIAATGAASAGLAQAATRPLQTDTVPHTSIHRVQADGVSVFYREAGAADAPVVLLLHGFPTSSFQYRELIPRLADRYRVIAPDLPGFGFTEVPQERGYTYSFDALAKTILAFTEALQLKRYALYVFDYGAPTGFRLAMAHPERVTAIVSQNGNAYEEGDGSPGAEPRGVALAVHRRGPQAGADRARGLHAGCGDDCAAREYGHPVGPVPGLRE
jgi:pimeloyl-ACP methyl ester carboxylesterase